MLLLVSHSFFFPFFLLANKILFAINFFYYYRLKYRINVLFFFFPGKSLMVLSLLVVNEIATDTVT